MNTLRKTIAFMFLSVSAGWSAAASAATIDDKIDQFVQPLTDVLSAFIFFSVPIAGTDIPLIVVWLIFGACFFTAYLGFINVRGFKHAVDIVRVDFVVSTFVGRTRLEAGRCAEYYDVVTRY